ncbi:MAG: T9SS type A sorting domain-containing protein [Ferruginibacter sp.]
MNKFILSIVFIFLGNYICFAQDFLKLSNGANITVESGATLYVNGGINLDNTAVLNNAGIVILDKTSAGTADLTDNTLTTYNYGTGRFVFTGTGAQNIKSINQFDRIDVDNSGLTLLSDIYSKVWYLKTGKVNTAGFIAIANASSATAIQADAANANFSNSWFNGKLRRYITPGSVNNYSFPIGDATSVKAAEMDNLTANPLTGVNHVTVNFGHKPGTDAGLNVFENGIAYSSVNDGGIWFFVPDAAATGGKYDLKLFFNGFTGLADNTFGTLNRINGSNNAADWLIPAGSVIPATGTAGRTVAGGYAKRNNIAVFGQFGIGMSMVVLPLQLLDFTAAKKDKTVQLKWVTTNEVNTSHFEIYRSAPGGSMQYIGKVNAAGVSATQLNYTFTDQHPLAGTNFYQLKMVDKDNKFKWSAVVSAALENSFTFSVYPNPVVNSIAFVNYSGGEIKAVRLIAADGKQVNCSFSNQTNNQLKVLLPYNIAKGTYTLQIVTKEGANNQLIMVQ